MSPVIHFAFNPTSWDDSRCRPWPGGMADRLVEPILPHLAGEWSVSNRPRSNCVNVYYAFRGQYDIPEVEVGVSSVFVSHGIADKYWRPGGKVNLFDWVAVSGPAWTSKMLAEGFPHHRILEVGYAKLDPLFGAPRVPSRGRVRVLWAPTHGGGGERVVDGSSARSSWHHRDEVLDLLDQDRFEVTVAAHPRHRADHRATFDEYLDCDVVIADGGSTIYEAWALDIPVVFPSWLVGAANQQRSRTAWTFEAELYQRRVGRHADRPDELVGLVAEAAADGITAAEQEFVEPILPRRYRGVSGRLHAEALDDIAAGRPPRHVARPNGWVTFLGPRGRMVRVPPEQAAEFAGNRRWRRGFKEVAGGW